MSLLRILGLGRGRGRGPMSREEIIRMVARKSSSGIHSIQGDDRNVGALPVVDVYLSEDIYGSEVRKLREDIRNGSADDLLEAVSTQAFPVTGIYAIAGNSAESFSVRVRYDLRPRAERDTSPSL